jgi:hypothetical protein
VGGGAVTRSEYPSLYSRRRRGTHVSSMLLMCAYVLRSDAPNVGMWMPATAGLRVGQGKRAREGGGCRGSSGVGKRGKWMRARGRRLPAHATRPRVRSLVHAGPGKRVEGGEREPRQEEEWIADPSAVSSRANALSRLQPSRTLDRADLRLCFCDGWCCLGHLFPPVDPGPLERFHAVDILAPAEHIRPELALDGKAGHVCDDAPARARRARGGRWLAPLGAGGREGAG